MPAQIYKEDSNMHIDQVPTGQTLCVLARSFSGKSTQCTMLVEKLKACGSEHLYTYVGSECRRIAEEDSELGRAVRKYIVDLRRFPPSELVLEVMLSPLDRALDDPTTVHVYDGSPRMLEEAKALDARLADLGRPPSFCVHIDVPREECVRRFRASSEDRGRSDDDISGLESRLDEFDAHTLDVIEYYRAEGRLIEISGIGTPDEISEALMKELMHIS